MLERLRKTILCTLWLLIGAFSFFVFLPTPTTSAPHVAYGVTFTPSHAQYLGLEPRQLYTAVLDDLGVRNLRLAAHWDAIEPIQGQWDFRELDWELAEAGKRGAAVVLAIGRKLPRWPECRVPVWAANQSSVATEQSILSMLAAVVVRYRTLPTVKSWQVENEPYFTFGNCPPLSRTFYDRELALVRSLDPRRPITATDSGELSAWIPLARRADVLGVSMYRRTWNPLMGYFSYPLSPSFYARKAALTQAVTGTRVILSELQMEPWLPGKSIFDTPYSELEKSFTIQRFLDNLQFARNAGFDTQYLWGVEWWAWAQAHGHSEFWQEARKVFAAEVRR